MAPLASVAGLLAIVPAAWVLAVGEAPPVPRRLATAKATPAIRRRRPSLPPSP